MIDSINKVIDWINKVIDSINMAIDWINEVWKDENKPKFTKAVLTKLTFDRNNSNLYRNVISLVTNNIAI